ncbi:retrovirus-related pol polyprotein from transposon TNT 1-94 [Tanacetum coccineum]
MVTVRAVITLAIHNNWLLEQLDVNNAFLHGDLYEEVYMRVPQGYVTSLPPNTQQLHNKLSIKDLGAVHYYLGIEFLRNKSGMVISERKYALELLKYVGVLEEKPTIIPLDLIKKLIDK